MVSIAGTKPLIYWAPSAHGNRQARGLDGWIARRPLTAFLAMALGVSWLGLSVPVLAFSGVIPGADLPIEIFALGATLVVLLPVALWVTDGHAGVRAPVPAMASLASPRK